MGLHPPNPSTGIPLSLGDTDFRQTELSAGAPNSTLRPTTQVVPAANLLHENHAGVKQIPSQVTSSTSSISQPSRVLTHFADHTNTNLGPSWKALNVQQQGTTEWCSSGEKYDEGPEAREASSNGRTRVLGTAPTIQLESHPQEKKDSPGRQLYPATGGPEEFEFNLDDFGPLSESLDSDYDELIQNLPLGEFSSIIGHGVRGSIGSQLAERMESLSLGQPYIYIDDRHYEELYFLKVGILF